MLLSQAASAGPQTDTAYFASWEGSTRGIGSKLMASMGYVVGQGLGTSRPGAIAPLEVPPCTAPSLHSLCLLDPWPMPSRPDNVMLLRFRLYKGVS